MIFLSIKPQNSIPLLEFCSGNTDEFDRPAENNTEAKMPVPLD